MTKPIGQYTSGGTVSSPWRWASAPPLSETSTTPGHASFKLHHQAAHTHLHAAGRWQSLKLCAMDSIHLMFYKAFVHSCFKWPIHFSHSTQHQTRPTSSVCLQLLKGFEEGSFQPPRQLGYFYTCYRFYYGNAIAIDHWMGTCLCVSVRCLIWCLC